MRARGASCPRCATWTRAEGPKTVRYWRMAVTGGEFGPNDEVDAIRWLTPKRAAKLLSYEHDRQLVQGLAYDQ